MRTFICNRISNFNSNGLEPSNGLQPNSHGLQLIAMAPNLEAMAHKGPEDPETRLRETLPVAAFLDFQASEYHIVREHGCKRFLHTSLSQSYAGLD